MFFEKMKPITYILLGIVCALLIFSFAVAGDPTSQKEIKPDGTVKWDGGGYGGYGGPGGGYGGWGGFGGGNWGGWGGGRGWGGGPGWGGGWGGGCRWGCCDFLGGGFLGGGFCRRCCYTAQEALAYMQNQAKP